jgi:hypothetical protein
MSNPMQYIIMVVAIFAAVMVVVIFNGRRKLAKIRENALVPDEVQKQPEEASPEKVNAG